MLLPEQGKYGQPWSSYHPSSKIPQFPLNLTTGTRMHAGSAQGRGQPRSQSRPRGLSRPTRHRVQLGGTPFALPKADVPDVPAAPHGTALPCSLHRTSAGPAGQAAPGPFSLLPPPCSSELSSELSSASFAAKRSSGGLQLPGQYESILQNRLDSASEHYCRKRRTV